MSEISLVRLRKKEELRALLEVFSRAFEASYDVGDQYLDHLLDNETTAVFGAVKGGKLVGGVVACEMVPIHGSKEIYLYDIAVDPFVRRQGVGRKLFQALKEHARRVGAKTIFVEAESEDRGATLFYRSLRGEELAVNHFNFSC